MAKRGISRDMISMISMGFIVVFLLIAIVALYYMNGKNLLETFTGNKRYCLEYYYMDGCGHCDRFNESGVWEELKNTYGNQIEFYKYNNREVKDKVDKHNITGFPTIIVTENDNIKAEYNGNREKGDIEKFISSYI